MKKTIDSAVKYQEVHGVWPSHVMAADLLIEDQMEIWRARSLESSSNKAVYDRWRDDGTLQKKDAERVVCQGALQMIASQLIGQSTQKSAGSSEFHGGLQDLDRIRDEQIQRYRAEQRASRPASKKKAGRPKRKLKPRKPDPDIVL